MSPPRIRPSRTVPTKPPLPAAAAGLPAKASVSFAPIAYKKKGCYTKCDRDQAQAVLDWIRQVSCRTWAEIQGSGGRSSRTGLHWEPRPGGHSKLTSVPTGRTLASMRVGGASRVWGYRAGDAFYVLVFDMNHDFDP